MRTSIARPLVKFGAQFGVILVLATGLSGCETMASLDPTGLLSSETEITPPDANSAAASPELANIPAAPQVPDDQRNVASSLAAQGAQAQYSADALRAGTEASAPVPGAAAPVSPQVAAALAAADAPPSANDAPPSAAAPAPVPVAASPPPTAAPPAPAPMAVASANPNAAVPAVPPPDSVPGRLASLASAPATAPAAAPVRTPAPPPPGAEPAVPAVPPAGAIRSTLMGTPVMSDAALGFRPSTAPALDPTVSNFVSPPILTRYRQTSAAGSGSSGGVVGGNGAVVAASAAVGGLAPTTVVYFPGDGVLLSAAARTQIRAAVTAFKAGGGTGSIRVVGHASSRTANMPVERHLEVIFEKSQKRANAVAQELIRQGVPADHVQIDAVGDSQPVYYESMPKGEEGNRRAEIFVSS
ncbi:MAG: OmpA family protein [Alphaproteobacteria bacterium]|nr:OmpA family protein [Alphaproteobacteria bacterium]